jgi:hypothetical protein
MVCSVLTDELVDGTYLAFLQICEELSLERSSGRGEDVAQRGADGGAAAKRLKY